MFIMMWSHNEGMTTKSIQQQEDSLDRQTLVVVNTQTQAEYMAVQYGEDRRKITEDRLLRYELRLEGIVR